MKTDLTKEIESALCRRAIRKCKRFALEVSVPNGICDFVTVDFWTRQHFLPHITCYEIKISFADFKSKNGHNFVGDDNYYVVPKKLWEDKIKNKILLGSGAGLIVYDKGAFYTKVKPDNIHFRKRLSLDQKYLVIDTILMRWTSGGMYKDLKSLGCDLRHLSAKA